MNFVNKTATVVLSLGLVSVMSTVDAAGRKGEYEFAFQTSYQQSESISQNSGTEIDFKSDVGFGFSIGYNYSDHLVGRAEFNWSSPTYGAFRVFENGEREGFGGELDAASLMLGGDYYFLKGPLTPFVGISAGWSFIDTNIATGETSSECWYDPWYGHVCGTERHTFTETSFTWGASAGVRFDFGRSGFARLGYHQRWIDIGGNVGTPDFGLVKLEFGARY